MACGVGGALCSGVASCDSARISYRFVAIISGVMVFKPGESQVISVYCSECSGWASATPLSRTAAASRAPITLFCFHFLAKHSLMHLQETIICATAPSSSSTGPGAISLHDIQTGSTLASFKQTNAGPHCTAFTESRHAHGGFMLASQPDKSILNVYNFQKVLLVPNNRILKTDATVGPN